MGYLPLVVLGVLWGLSPQAFGWGKMATLPADTTRFLGCPLTPKPAVGDLAGKKGQWLTYKDYNFDQDAWWQPFSSDLAQLAPKLPQNLYLVSLVDIRNIKGHYGFRYLGNGGSQQTVLPWSSSKWMAALNTMRRLHEYGLSAHSRIGSYELGDLITTSHTGFATPTVKGVDSNYIGTLFQNFGGRQTSQQLVQQWLRRPQESFASGYGGRVPAATVECQDLQTGKTAKIAHSPQGGGRSRVATLTFAEALKRVITHDDPWNNVRYPGIVADDLRMLFYGHPDHGLGGMLGAYEEVARAALGGKEQLDAQTGGKWRIYSKTGSASWNTGQEQMINAIICLPEFDGGRLLAVSFHAKGPVRKEGLRRFKKGFKELMATVVPGFTAPSKAGPMPVVGQ